MCRIIIKGGKMAFYSEQFIDEIKSNNNIVDVISDYVTLKRTGTSYKGLCPFHKEKTPSFSVSSDKQIFHCFGCGVGGDVVKFVMNIENVSFKEAVEMLADRAKMELPQDDEVVDVERVRLKERLYKMNVDTAKYFYQNLLSSKVAIEYLNKRRLDEQTVKKFGLGFANGTGNDLRKYLLSLGYTDDEMVQGGLVIKNDNGNFVDRFRQRLMFPIFDVKERVIAFGGRVLDDSLPKYMNSPETPVYNKSKNIFGLNFARKSKVTKFLMVEGYMDVISLHRNGIPNAVASLGTALTESQGRLLKKYASEILIGYDADGAGQAATLRGLDILAAIGCNVKVLKISGAKDPDEFVNKYGPDRFIKLMDNAITLVEFKLEKLKKELDITTTDGKIEYLKRIAVIISKIESSIEKDIYIKKVASEVGIGIEAIYAEINKLAYGNNYKPIKFKPEENKVFNETLNLEGVPENVYHAEKMAIFLLCQNEQAIYQNLKKHINYDKFKVNLYKELAEILYAYYESGKKSNIVDLFAKDEQVNIITGIMQEEYDFGNNIERAIEDVVYILRKYELEEEKNEILKKLEKREDNIAIEELESRLSEIIIELHSFSAGRRK